jgi:kynureninase
MPVLSLAAIEAGLDDVLDAGVGAIRAKSVALSEYLISLADEVLSPRGFEVASPRDPDRRGSHVSLAHELAWPVCQAMITEANVIPDFRTPDNIRLGLAPLYTRFVDVHTAVHRIAEIVENDLHLRYLDAIATVT